MAKLIIRHGDHVTEHELGADSVVVGRDPQCELSYADRKLSRHHARIVAAPDGTDFRIVDLGSRNGCWVNEEQVEERTLSDGDEIRLGGLRIEFVASAPAGSGSAIRDDGSPDTDATVHLGGGDASPAPGSAKDAGTLPVDLSDPNPDAAASEDSTRTILPRGGPEPDAASSADESVDDDSLTVERPPSGATVPLRTEPPRKEFDTGTVLFRAEQSPKIVVPKDSSGEHPAGTQESGDESFRSRTPYAQGARRASGGVVRIALLLAAVAGLALVVLPLPLARTMSAAVEQQTRLRGRLLAELLAATNARIAAEGRRGELSVARAAGEAFVSEALLVDRAGRVLAPSARAGEALEIEGVDPSRVRATEALATETGLVFVAPMTVDGALVGISVVRVGEIGGFGSSRALFLTMLGTLLLLVGAAAGTLVGSRALLAPIDRLREDVDAVGEGRLDGVTSARAYRELEELASSLDRWVETKTASRRDPDPSSEPDARVTLTSEGAEPTLVPGESGKD